MNEEQHVGAQLEDEEPATPSVDDARAWLTIYEDLIAFTEVMLARTRRFGEGRPLPVQRHLNRTNVRVMEEELEQFRARRDHWRARVTDLDS